MGCGCGRRNVTRTDGNRRGRVQQPSRAPAIKYEIRDQGAVVATFLTAYEARVYSQKFGTAAPVSVAS